ncbi:hypothetical protein NADE_006849 [Nannochloris sp. 'desiccata']|nr:hypothetical protein NADE_006849 [Chlorella desiccata (nom. nud.)]
MSELMEGEYEADDVELSISNSTPSFNIGDEFIIDPKLLPAFEGELQAAAPLQIWVAANDAAESKNANMLNTAEAAHFYLAFTWMIGMTSSKLLLQQIIVNQLGLIFLP